MCVVLNICIRVVYGRGGSVLSSLPTPFVVASIGGERWGPVGRGGVRPSRAPRSLVDAPGAASRAADVDSELCDVHGARADSYFSYAAMHV
jgi:hypothetical protein